jgi:putative ABC transport system permease protein
MHTRAAGVVAILTLALGIGATTTMASVAYATLYRQVPFAEPGRLAMLYNTRGTPRDGLVKLRWSYPNIVELRRATTSFEALASYSPTSIGARAGGAAEQIDGEFASPEYFPLLRITPVAGRTFAAADDGAAVAVISEKFWRSRFDGNASAVGGPLRVSDVPLTVIGILPDGFSGLSGRADVWLPPWLAPRLTYGEYLTSPQHFISAVARLKPGATFDQANAELAAIGDRFADANSPPTTAWSAAAITIVDARVDPAARRSVVLLFSAAGCLLLIACVNVAGVTFARSRGREREMAIRLAIGASRWRLVRQLLSEGLALATVAGALGTAFALWGVRVVGSTSPTFIASWRNDYGSIGSFADPSFDIRVLVFALAVTLVTTLLSALMPALSASRPHLVKSLRAGDRGATRRSRALSGLVVTELAFAVLLLAGAGLLIESFARMQSLRMGFNPDRILTFWLRPSGLRYTPAEGPKTVERFLTAIEAVPGVERAAVNRCTPFAGCSRTSLTFTDRENDPQNRPTIGRHYISADYFSTLGIPLRAGRALTAGDRPGAPAVTVINETAARRFWPGENPIGKRVRFGSTTGFTDSAGVEIVGIVGDVKYEGAELPVGPDFYTSYLQFAFPDTMVMVKTRGEPAEIVPLLRAAAATVDPAVPLYEVMSLDERVVRALGRPRFNTTIVALFAGAALLLAALGVYGVLSFTVSARTREIGVRLALGASPRRVLGAFVGHGIRLSAAGVAIGLAAALVLSRSASGLVQGLGQPNVPVLAAVSLVMLLVAAASAFLPARRASRVDPMQVLKNE